MMALALAILAYLQNGGIRFDTTISIGTLIHLVGTILILSGLYHGLSKRITIIDMQHQATARKVEDLHDWWMSDMERRATFGRPRKGES